MHDQKCLLLVTIVAGLGVFGICIFAWIKGRARIRITILVLLFLSICALPVLLGGPDKWNILTAVATALAVIVALFYDEIKKLVYRPTISIYVGKDLFDPQPDKLWVRGRIENTGDGGAERCRVKLATVEGPNIQPGRIENGSLEWQGGMLHPVRLDPEEPYIFDIGTRANQHSPLNLLAFFGPNLVEYPLPAGDYTLILAIYGQNIRVIRQRVSLNVGTDSRDDIEIACI